MNPNLAGIPIVRSVVLIQWGIPSFQCQSYDRYCIYYFSNDALCKHYILSPLPKHAVSPNLVGSSLVMDTQQRQARQTSQAMEDVQGPSDSRIADKTHEGDETTAERPTYTVHLEVRLKMHSTARADLIKQLVHKHISADQQLYVPGEISGWQSEPRLAQNVHRIMACETCEYYLALSSDCAACTRKDASADPLLTFLSSMSNQFDRCRRGGARDTCLSAYRS